MCAAPTDNQPLYSCTAALAGFAGTLIGIEIFLMMAALAVSVPIIAEGRPSIGNAVTDYFIYRLIQPVNFFIAEGLCLSFRMNPRQKERLIRINISQSGNGRLV